MSLQIDAIYDNGVLKPLEPLSLPDQARVKLTVDANVGELNSDVLVKQQAALDELRAAVKELPQTQNNDGWSVRQHDEFLYGKQR